MTDHDALDQLEARALSAERHRHIRRVGGVLTEDLLWRVMGREVEGDWRPTLAGALDAWERSATGV